MRKPWLLAVVLLAAWGGIFGTWIWSIRALRAADADGSVASARMRETSAELTQSIAAANAAAKSVNEVLAKRNRVTTAMNRHRADVGATTEPNVITKEALAQSNQLTADFNQFLAEENRLNAESMRLNTEAAQRLAVRIRLDAAQQFRRSRTMLLSGINITFLYGLTAFFIYYARLRRRRAFRIKNNLCVNCGYDLRGSSGKCPECGLAPLVKAVGLG